MRQLVAIGGNTVFQFKNFIGVLVDFILGRCGQADQWRVKVVEDVLVLVVNRAMCLIADDQVKVSAGKQLAVLILYAVNDIVHGLVGGKHTMRSVVVLFFAEVCNGQVRQQVHKAALCLRDKAVAIRQKQDVFHPAMLQQHIAQGNHRTCFAGAGSHDQQSLAAVAGKGITGRFDSALLVITSGNTAVYHHIPQAGTHGLQVEQLFQITFGINGSALAFRVNRVGNARFKAVCQKDDRAAVILLFQQIGIQFCLLATFCHIYTGALGFYHSQRTTIVAVKHIIGIAHLGFVGHTGQFHLILPVFAFGPACIGEHGINVQLAGLILGQIKRFGDIGLLLLGTARSEFLFQCGVFCDEGSKVNVLFFVRLRCGGFGGLLQQGAVKVSGSIVFPIAIRHKIKENVQVFKA